MIATLLPLDSHSLCTKAKRSTGLSHFGEPRIEPALSTLVNSLEREAELHSFGRFLMRAHLRGLLETRLRLTNAFQAADQEQEARIEKPIFIIGVPRSGSTYLHELLAEVPGYRAPRVWEVMFPIRGTAGGLRDARSRVRKAALCLWCFRMFAPRADAVFPMRANTPHECVAIHSYTFLSQEFVSTCRVPSYERFLRYTDLTPAYTFEKRFLQHLQGNSNGTRWVLKSPDHVHGLEELLKVFPDATIIQTHRNPLEVLQSSTQLTHVLQGLYSRPSDLGDIYAREAAVLAKAAERFMVFRDAHPELADRIIDVRYTDLVEAPVTTVNGIIERLEGRMAPEVAVRLQNFAAGRARYKGRRGALQDPGLCIEPGLSVRFKDYCARFSLPFSETT